MREVVRERAGVEVLTWPELDGLGVDAVVTTRHGGVSEGPYATLNLGSHVGDEPEAVAENRARAARALGASRDHLVLAHQVHGTTVAVVDTPHDGGRAPEGALAGTDVLVTAGTGPVLVTLVADCSPVLLVDPEARVLATVHAGWRGALAPGGGAVGAALRAMATLGASPAAVLAIVGPTVPADRYEVGEDVAAAARSALGRTADAVLRRSGPRYRFDVAGANRLQLLAAGVPEARVHLSASSTSDPRFFSDRAERPCGRFGLLARLG